MKKIIVAAAVAVLVSACCQTKKTATPTTSTQSVTKAKTEVATVLEYKVVENFFLKNTVGLTNGFTVLTANDADGFNRQFGAAKTMTNQTIVPDFSKATVVAVATKESNVQTTLEVGHVSSEGNGINIHLNVKTGSTQSFSTQPVLIISLPKQAAGQKVHVLVGGKEVASAAI